MNPVTVPTDFIVLEYSVSQKCFHRTTVVGAMQSNLRVISRNLQGVGHMPDYLMIGVFTTHAACDAFYKAIEPVIRMLEDQDETDCQT